MHDRNRDNIRAAVHCSEYSSQLLELRHPRLAGHNPGFVVSFWLQLESPTTAALTVGVLAEPTRGQALDKAGFRLFAPGDEVRFLRAGQRPRAWRT